MFMSIVSRTSAFDVYAELAGARVLISGLSQSVGVDVARAFADHKGRLAILTGDTSPAMTELAAVLAEAAAEIRLFRSAGAVRDVECVQRLAGEMGGFDSVINFVHFDDADLAALERGMGAEALIAAKLEAAHLIARVAANRMRLTWTDGSILTVVTMAGGSIGRTGAVADLIRSMVGQLTRGLAREWAEHGVRINAIAPETSVSALLEGQGAASDADIAAIALYLASRKGRSLSGHVLEAKGTVERCC